MGEVLFSGSTKQVEACLWLVQPPEADTDARPHPGQEHIHSGVAVLLGRLLQQPIALLSASGYGVPMSCLTDPKICPSSRG